MNIIIFGPQASGKGTIANKLHGKYGYSIIGTGNLLRNEIKKGTKLGKTIASCIDNGNLVPDELMFEIVKKEIKNARSGFILDGFPRNMKQAEMLEEFLDDIKKKIDVAIYLNVSNETIMERLSGRIVCENCNENYHTKTKELIPKTPGICDKCGKALTRRVDENPEAVKTRLEWHKEQTEPLREYYEEKNILKIIDSEGSPDEVMAKVEKIIKNIV